MIDMAEKVKQKRVWLDASTHKRLFSYRISRDFRSMDEAVRYFLAKAGWPVEDKARVEE